MNAIKLQKKRQRKEAKRNLKRATIKKTRNQWNMLGKARQTLAQERCRRKLGIKYALESLTKLVNKWNDKIPLDLIEKIEKQKSIVLDALKTKNITFIDQAIKNFVPLNQEVNEIVAKHDKPVIAVPQVFVEPEK